jgi:transcriptional regulator with XRE-family HTH domain
MGAGVIRMAGKQPVDLWLNKARKKAMGQRLAAEIKRAKTTKAAIAKKIGRTRQTLTLACRDGSISLELLTEVCRLTGASLDWVVTGQHPHADPEFLALLDQLRAAAVTPR